MIVRLARSIVFWVALAFTAAGVGVAVIMAHTYNKETRLERSGAVLVGTVDAKRTEMVPTERGPSIEEFVVAYRFDGPSGSLQSGNSNVDPSFYDSVEEGDAIEVLYDTTDPSRHQLVATRSPPGGILLLGMAFGALFAFIGFFIMAVAIRSAANARP